MGQIQFASQTLDRPRTSDEMRTSMAATQAAFEAVSDEFTGLGADRWQEADRRFARVVAGLDGEAQAKATQIAAAAMLRVWLPEATGPQAAEVAARHVTALVEAGSSEAALVMKGLELAGDKLPTSVRARLAAEAVRSAEASLARDAAKRSASTHPKTAQLPDAGQTSAAEIEAAISRLQVMAAS